MEKWLPMDERPRGSTLGHQPLAYRNTANRGNILSRAGPVCLWRPLNAFGAPDTSRCICTRHYREGGWPGPHQSPQRPSRTVLTEVAAPIQMCFSQRRLPGCFHLALELSWFHWAVSPWVPWLQLSRPKARLGKKCPRGAGYPVWMLLGSQRPLSSRQTRLQPVGA